MGGVDEAGFHRQGGLVENALEAGADDGGEDEVGVRETVVAFDFEVGAFDLTDGAFAVLRAPLAGCVSAF